MRSYDNDMAKKKITIEDLAGMVKRGFDDVDKRFERVEKEMREGFKLVGERFEQVDERFDQIDKRFEQIDQQLEYITARVDVISHDTSDLPDMRQGLQDHEHRIGRLERKVSPR